MWTLGDYNYKQAIQYFTFLKVYVIAKKMRGVEP
jgi:hypothetical protein